MGTGRENNQDSMLQVIQEKVDHWLANKSHASLASLGKKTGIPYTSLRRLMQGEAPLSFEKVSQILSVVCDHQSMLNILGDLYPEMSPALNQLHHRAMALKTNGKALIEDDEVEAYLSNPKYFQVFALCTNKAGISDFDLKDQLGRLGLAAAYELLEKGILIYTNDNRLKLKGEIISTLSRISDLDVMINSCQIFKTRQAGVYTDYVVNSFNKDALTKIQEKQLEMRALLTELMDDTSAHGDIPISYNAAFGRLDVEPVEPLYKGGEEI